MRRLVAGLILGGLRRTFDSVVWLGPVPRLPAGPVVAYANHQSFHDGYLLWLVAQRTVARRFLVWMEEVDRFPFFALQGALPFPPADVSRRTATIRRTRRFLTAPDPPLLAYFPEGRLHGADEPLLPIDPVALTRLHRALGAPRWWPVGIHLTWRTASRPTALLTAGLATAGPPADPVETLRELGHRLRKGGAQETVILDSPRRVHERATFSWTRGLFRHRLGGGR